MKKWTALVLCLVLICSCFSVVSAESAGGEATAAYDISSVTDNNDMYTVDVDEANGVAFVESNIPASMEAFTHKYESESRYSSMHFDILVVDYGTKKAIPALRLLATYCADEFLNINSVTFTLDGMDYTFSDVAVEQAKVKDEEGAAENLIIKFGNENATFLVAVENLITGFSNLDDLLDETKAPKIKMVLHGDEDVEATLGGIFLVDFIFICEQVFLQTGGVSYMKYVEGNPMTVTAAE